MMSRTPVRIGGAEKQYFLISSDYVTLLPLNTRTLISIESLYFLLIGTKQYKIDNIYGLTNHRKIRLIAVIKLESRPSSFE